MACRLSPAACRPPCRRSFRSTHAARVYPLDYAIGTIASSSEPTATTENRGVGAREWAAIGNVYKLSAAAGFLLTLFVADRAFNRHVPADFVAETWAAAIAFLVLSIVL